MHFFAARSQRKRSAVSATNCISYDERLTGLPRPSVTEHNMYSITKLGHLLTQQ